MKLENPTDLIGYYGYDNDGPLTPAAGAVQSKDNQVEATKTEPDKNNYLILADQKGAEIMGPILCSRAMKMALSRMASPRAILPASISMPTKRTA